MSAVGGVLNLAPAQVAVQPVGTSATLAPNATAAVYYYICCADRTSSATTTMTLNVYTFQPGSPTAANYTTSASYVMDIVGTIDAQCVRVRATDPSHAHCCRAAQPQPPRRSLYPYAHSLPHLFCYAGPTKLTPSPLQPTRPTLACRLPSPSLAARAPSVQIWSCFLRRRRTRHGMRLLLRSSALCAGFTRRRPTSPRRSSSTSSTCSKLARTTSARAHLCPSASARATSLRSTTSQAARRLSFLACHLKTSPSRRQSTASRCRR